MKSICTQAFKLILWGHCNPNIERMNSEMHSISAVVHKMQLHLHVLYYYMGCFQTTVRSRKPFFLKNDYECTLYLLTVAVQNFLKNFLQKTI